MALRIRELKPRKAGTALSHAEPWLDWRQSGKFLVDKTGNDKAGLCFVFDLAFLMS